MRCTRVTAMTVTHVTALSQECSASVRARRNSPRSFAVSGAAHRTAAASAPAAGTALPGPLGFEPGWQ
jgi:hypothetical protein